MSKNLFERRDFIRTSVAATVVASLPFNFMSCSNSTQKRTIPVWPKDKLNIAVIGVNNMGYSNLKNCLCENVVAICDVDTSKTDKILQIFKEKHSERIPPLDYQDYRVMLKEMADSIDGVVIATPDHNHALITLDCMKAGKHVYTQKPLTRTVYESRLLTRAAEKYPNIVTQMGNQAASAESTQWICEAIWNGDIGEVKEVHAWTNRPIWPQNMNEPAPERPPRSMDWDLWCAPCPKIPYSSSYHPWNWRGFYAWGTGAFGDIACHTLDSVFRSLKLKYPIKVEATSSKWNKFSPPESEMVTFVFPEREALKKVNMPEVTITWYDGGFKPPRPIELKDKERLGGGGGGVLFIGTEGTLMCHHGGREPRILGDKFPKDYQPPKTMRRVEFGHLNEKGRLEGQHEEDWFRAIRESSTFRVKPYSCFEFAGPFNEMVAMGSIVPQLQSLERTLKWDGETMEFTNIDNNETMSIPTGYRIDRSFVAPRYVSDKEKVNAKEYAQNLIKPMFREGWELKL